jgi:hypothetical protein
MALEVGYTTLFEYNNKCYKKFTISTQYVHIFVVLLSCKNSYLLHIKYSPPHPFTKAPIVGAFLFLFIKSYISQHEFPS